MRFIGDVHGKIEQYAALCWGAPKTLQVGDMGAGFSPIDYIGLDMNHRFIRGNHDDPAECKMHDRWIPDGTFWEGVFCVGGADSIDKARRVEGLDWWRDEQLSAREFDAVLETYSKERPDVVVTHDGPKLVQDYMNSHHRESSITNQALEAMFWIHQPKVWIFGHHHIPREFVVEGTRFICLAELEYLDLEI